MSAMEKYKATLAACPSADGDVPAWLTEAARSAAAAGVPAAVAVPEITAALAAFRFPSPIGEVGSVVARAYWKAGACVPDLEVAIWAEILALNEEFDWLRSHGAGEGYGFGK